MRGVRPESTQQARVDLLASWIQGNIASHGGAGPSDGSGDSGSDPPDPPSGGTPETEPNNAYKKANALAALMSGTLVAGDRDWFTWSIDGEKPYDIELTAAGDGQLLMWKRVGSQYYTIDNTSPTSFSHTASGPGTYWVAAYSKAGQSQSYSLSLAK